MVGNEIADRNTKVSENSQRRYSETVTNEDDKDIYSEKRKEINDELRLTYFNNEISKIINLIINITADAVAKSYDGRITKVLKNLQ